MLVADLYIRVSTDEQADKGYSQRDQEERLKKYCQLQFIKVRKVIFEDHSAKTFNRPEWIKLLGELKKQKGKHSDLILFTKWDRFSRNAGDAYQMINVLKKFGIEPQAVEQPLDMAIPENKIMLAFYLAAPEVENDRRALNVFHGMRRARKEGRYMGVAPIGYSNRISEDGRKYIAPKEPEASHMKWIFETLGEGHWEADQVRKMANERGFPISRSNFYREIRNPVYCGRIPISKYKDEEAHSVSGQHEGLISESLFYKVQDLLDGNERAIRTTIKSCDSLPLRGFLNCATCDKHLTGSASKGKKGGYYFYYHAQPNYGCGCRYKAEILNDALLRELNKFVPRPGMVALYQELINDIYKNNFGETRNIHQKLINQIKTINARLDNARDMLFDNKIEPEDFKILKLKSENQLEKLERELAEVLKKKANMISIDKMLSNALKALSNLPKLYEDADNEKKRQILGSIFREKLRFDGSQYRTPILNEGARLIFLINNELSRNKNGTAADLTTLSRSVLGAGIEPALALRRTGF